MQANSNSVPINRKTLLQFFRNVSINPRLGFGNNPCWLWVGTVTSGGYARFVFNQVPHQAHRLAYEWFIGGVDDPTLHADHWCRRRHCVNPMHIEIVTSRINTLRGDAPSAINARKTHCLRGHEFTRENTQLFDYGNSGRKGRSCRTCSRLREKKPEYKAKRNTRLANKRRSVSRSPRTHCVNGHEFTPENTRHPKNHPSWRQCRTCAKQSRQRYVDAHRKRPQTHCAKGHLMRPAGGPYKHRCLICVNENGRRARQRKRSLLLF